MKITAISDLHGHYPKLPGGDLLIVAGDLTARDTQAEYLIFREWLQKQDYKKKIFICGNHDECIEKGLFYFNHEWMGAEYLCDSGTEFEGLKIWGSPWTAQFPGINPKCCAFTMPFGCDTEEHLMDQWEIIPHDTDILITHSPPYGILDRTCRNENVGSKSLYSWLKYVERPRLHVFGHIHEAYGMIEHFPTYDDHMMISVNASHVNERYKAVNDPVEITL